MNSKDIIKLNDAFVSFIHPAKGGGLNSFLNSGRVYLKKICNGGHRLLNIKAQRFNVSAPAHAFFRLSNHRFVTAVIDSFELALRKLSTPARALLLWVFRKNLLAQSCRKFCSIILRRNRSAIANPHRIVDLAPAHAFFRLCNQKIASLLPFHSSRNGGHRLLNIKAQRFNVSAPAYAFSLVELMITLVTISCVLAALAPVVSKRLSSNSVSIGGGFGSGGGSGKITMECTTSGKFGDGCKMCTDDLCIICSSGESADKTLFLDPVDCKHKNCTEKYGTNCKTCSSSSCTECISTDFYIDGSKEAAQQCQTCPTGEICDGVDIINCSRVPVDGEYCDRSGEIKNCADKWPRCAKCTASGCSECVSGYNFNDGDCSPGETAWCDSDNFVMIGDLCVTKFNMGDSAALTIPHSVSVNYASTTQTCNPSASNLCCWSYSATASTCDSQNGGYSGCKRTVCDWWAASNICSSLVKEGHRFRLPTDTELSTFASESINKGVNGLQLCDTTSGRNSAQCADRTTKPSCRIGSGSTGSNKCIPSTVWSSVAATSTTAYDYLLSSGSWQRYTNNKTDARSVRCVSDLGGACTSGYYIQGTQCLPCSNKFPNCATCSASACTSCQEGYNLQGSNCVLTDWCTGASFKKNKVGNLCITAFNIGDSEDLPIPAGVTTVDASSTDSACFPSESHPCCWANGKTAGECTTAYGYSGCRRTVCDWWAANKACSSLNYRGHQFRLPTYKELNLGSYGARNLSFCWSDSDHTDDGRSAQCNAGSTVSPDHVYAYGGYATSNIFVGYAKQGQCTTCFIDDKIWDKYNFFAPYNPDMTLQTTKYTTTTVVNKGNSYYIKLDTNLKCFSTRACGSNKIAYNGNIYSPPSYVHSCAFPAGTYGYGSTYPQAIWTSNAVNASTIITYDMWMMGVCDENGENCSYSPGGGSRNRNIAQASSVRCVADIE